VLIGKPRAGIRGVKRKIPIFPQSPDDVSVARPAAVIDLDYPGLVADGDQEVTVPRSLDDGIGMQPVDAPGIYLSYVLPQSG